MQIELKSGPTLTQPTGASTEASQSAREKAISRLMQGSPTPSQPAASPEHQTAVLRQPTEAPRQENTSEAPTDTPAETKAPEEPISSQYAVLARKEKALRARDAQLRAREEALKAAQAPKAPERPAFDESKYISKDKLQSDLFGTLAELGLSYDQISAQATNAPTPDQIELRNTIKSLESKLDALRGDQEQFKKSSEEQQQQSYKQAVSQIRLETNTLVKNNDAYETIRETNSTDDVVELIEKTFATDGVLLTVEEAAQQVEDYLVEEALKIARIRKIQQRLNVAPPASATAPKQQTGNPQQPQLKTLTNAIASTGKLTSRQRAELAFRGELKKS